MQCGNRCNLSQVFRISFNKCNAVIVATSPNSFRSTTLNDSTTWCISLRISFNQPISRISDARISYLTPTSLTNTISSWRWCGVGLCSVGAWRNRVKGSAVALGTVAVLPVTLWRYVAFILMDFTFCTFTRSGNQGTICNPIVNSSITLHKNTPLHSRQAVMQQSANSGTENERKRRRKKERKEEKRGERAERDNWGRREKRERQKRKGEHGNTGKTEEKRRRETRSTRDKEGTRNREYERNGEYKKKKTSKPKTGKNNEKTEQHWAPNRDPQLLP